MATFTARVGASTEDGTKNPAFTPAWDTTGSSDGTGRNGLGSDDLTLGCRFTNVTIPSGSTINSAKLTLTAYTSDSNSVDTTVIGVDEDNTASFSSDPTGRAQTTASANWTQGSVTANTAYDTPALASVVQEIIDRAGWASGNAMGFIIKNNGTTGSANHFFYSYDGDTNKAILLTIDYTTGTTTSTTTTSTTTTSTTTTSTSTSTTTLPPTPEYWGVKVLTPNNDGSIILPKNLLLTSKNRVLKIHRFGSFSMTIAEATEATKTITFDELQYRPFVLVYMQRVTHDATPVVDTNYHLLDWSYFGATQQGYNYVAVYNNKITIVYYDDADVLFGFGPWTLYGFYYVFREEVKE